ncbi:MAG: ATP-binding protein [Firmicutes bacterium]|nr:ATP-binding protein [Bacillota bacterium]
MCKNQKTTIHLMCGYMGFGKSTIAKQIAKEHNAVMLSRDEMKLTIFGRNPTRDGFYEHTQKIREVIWDLVEKIIATGTDVVIDSGNWTADMRSKVYKRAKSITPNVILHVILCDMQVAKQRSISRTLKSTDTLEVDAAHFDRRAHMFEPVTEKEAKNYTIVYHSN